MISPDTEERTYSPTTCSAVVVFAGLRVHCHRGPHADYGHAAWLNTDDGAGSVKVTWIAALPDGMSAPASPPSPDNDRSHPRR